MLWVSPPTTPQRERDAERRRLQAQRVLNSPEHRRTPQSQGRGPPIPFLLHQTPPQNNYRLPSQAVPPPPPSQNGPENTVHLDENMRCHGNTVQSLINAIYPSLNLIEINGNNDEWFMERTILCAKNDAVDEVNWLCLKCIPGEIRLYNSADKAIPDGAAQDDQFQYPVEYLNSINGSGLPISRLQLKIGCPIMILRNLDISAGVCNGT
ncbi:hypothetical protein D9757_002964 [Collybiopsis confluens]|uniref:DNA helicase Pif1-like 2B domain-containing protein n=1 Tax=Collybiopsis confluens TaxID=2823264 RepID=A0A8H5HVQ6_9AGAR|nr:hypothetical protein D9757_002964 [Collybiopsis confluens]